MGLIKDIKNWLLNKQYNYINLETSILEAYSGLLETHQKICFFASYDEKGKIDEYVFKYLSQLYENEFDIYFCTTTSTPIDEDDLQKLKLLCVKIFRRKNVGLDFCSWKTCYINLNKTIYYKQILLTNDSILGPIFDLKTIFSKIKDTDSDLIGLTDNYEYSYHIQSYFLLFKEKAVQEFLPQFMSNVKVFYDKNLIVEKYEIGLSTLMLNKGYKIQALFPFENTLQKALELSSFEYFDEIRIRKVNSTIYFWNILIEEFGFPFIKRELLTKNVIKLNSLNQWKLIISKYNHEISTVISNYLLRLKN